MAEPTDPALRQHPIALRLGRITESILDFYDKTASAVTLDELDALEDLFKRYPKACAAKLRIAPTLLNKVLPNRSLIAHKSIGPDKSGKTLSVKELAKLGFTTTQLRALAGMTGEPEEAETK